MCRFQIVMNIIDTVIVGYHGDKQQNCVLEPIGPECSLVSSHLLKVPVSERSLVSQAK